MTKNDVKEQIRGKLIVSCQALSEEPLHSPYIMSRMAYAAMLGGAAGIRANSVADITEIKKTVRLPLIGIIKQEYEGSSVYITPTEKEVQELTECRCEIIAMDATARLRPGGVELRDFFPEIRNKYPEQLFMADCSTIEEGMLAAELGFDLIGTTMCGYTEYTKGTEIPNLHMISTLSEESGKPVIAEGGIWCPDDLVRVLEAGAFAAVVGTAITRPMDITKKYVQAIS